MGGFSFSVPIKLRLIQKDITVFLILRKIFLKFLTDKLTFPLRSSYLGKMGKYRVYESVHNAKTMFEL